MLIKKSQSKQVSNSPNCLVAEYDSSSENLSLATAKINGRILRTGESGIQNANKFIM